jgi:lipoate-protein ligase B
MVDVCEVLTLGRIDYEQAWKLQDRLGSEIASGARPATLLLLEHPHTYTFGRGGHAENLLIDQEQLKLRGISVHWVDRGGDVTYHGPGQLVGYPLVPLGMPAVSDGDSTRIPQADYVGYVRKLEQVLILALKAFSVTGVQIRGLTGVWVQPGMDRAPEKIAAIGVKVDARGVTRHGFALNIDTDPQYWNGIIGCGLKDSAVTTLNAQLGITPSTEAVMEEVVRCFGEVFGCEMKKRDAP